MSFLLDRTLGLTPRKVKTVSLKKLLWLAYINQNFMGNTNLADFFKNSYIRPDKSRFWKSQNQQKLQKNFPVLP